MNRSVKFRKKLVEADRRDERRPKTSQECTAFRVKHYPATEQQPIAATKKQESSLLRRVGDSKMDCKEAANFRRSLSHSSIVVDDFHLPRCEVIRLISLGRAWTIVRLQNLDHKPLGKKVPLKTRARMKQRTVAALSQLPHLSLVPRCLRQSVFQTTMHRI